ncbi:pre-mRNA-splicing factor cwc23 [Cryomyces antarcticus]
MPSDDLKQHAISDTDYYGLLGVNFETNEADIRRGYRKQALKYHPDKNAGNEAAVQKFHLLQIAYDVLSDSAAKALYDNARAARLQKQRQHDLFAGKRRQMKEDLERRESGFKRKRNEEEDAEAKLEREIRRLAEDGKRRRKEKEEMLNREKLEEEERLDNQNRDGEAPLQAQNDQAAPRGGTDVPEIDRSVKVRWAREGLGDAIDKERLLDLFSTFGKIENAFILKKEKRMRVGEKREKKMVATGVIVYSSIVSAHAAVEDTKKQKTPEYQVFESVYWASDKEPDFGQVGTSRSPPPDDQYQPSTPDQATKFSVRAALSGQGSAPSTPVSTFKARANGDGLKRVPSFASFTSANRNTPASSPFGRDVAQSPSLQEITMMRLREKQKLEDQIRKQDEEAAAAEAA